MRTVEDAIRELIERAIELARRFGVWWQLVNKASFAMNEAVVLDHEDFFATTSHALFESFSVITYQLFETRRDTISIPAIVTQLASTQPALAERVSGLIEQQRPLLQKAFAIRCGIYAHRSKRQAPEAIFASAGLLPDQMESIVNLTADVIGQLAAATGVDTKENIVLEIHHRKTCASDDTMLLMSTLREHAI